jgi:hypothetical protein
MHFPNDPRWDYGIGVRSPRAGERIVWVEVHSASSSHVHAVLSKLAWLKKWLATSAPLLAEFRGEFWWVATGSVAIQPGSPQRKKLASQGLRLCGGRLEIG